MQRLLILTVLLVVNFLLVACGGGTPDEPLLYTIRLQVVDENGLPVNGASVAGGDIFGSTAQGGILERSVTTAAQFEQHVSTTYRVEQAGCIVDRQELQADESSEGYSVITLHLACEEPLVRLDFDASELLIANDSVWVTHGPGNTITKMTLDGNMLGTFPVGEAPWRMISDGDHIWVVLGRRSVAKLDFDGNLLVTAVIPMAGVEDRITDLAFDGDGIWVSHFQVTKLALDASILWTSVQSNRNYKHLIFTGDTMVRTGGWGVDRPIVDVYDLEGNWLERVSFGPNFQGIGVGSVWDDAYDGDGIWFAGSCDVVKVDLDGVIVSGPHSTLSCGSFKTVGFDGEFLWVVDNPDVGASLLSRMSLDGQIIDTFPIGSATGRDMAFDGTSTWIIASGDEDPARGADEPPTTSTLWKITP